MSRLLYFGYGSNMLPARLQQPDRAPSARLLGRARIPRRQLTFDKLGQDGSGKCDAPPAAVGEVWGGVFEIDRNELRQLDLVEGLGVGYRRVTDLATLEPVARSSDPQPVEVFLYEALQTRTGIAPFDWYLELVLAGARALDLPPSYRHALESIASRRDGDAVRRARHRIALRSPT